MVLLFLLFTTLLVVNRVFSLLAIVVLVRHLIILTLGIFLLGSLVIVILLVGGLLDALAFVVVVVVILLLTCRLLYGGHDQRWLWRAGFFLRLVKIFVIGLHLHFNLAGDILFLLKFERVNANDVAANDEKVVQGDQIVIFLRVECLALEAAIEHLQLILRLRPILGLDHDSQGEPDGDVSETLLVPVVEQGCDIFLRKECFAVQSEEHEFDLIEPSICNNVHL